jgi:hypothetical protein
MNKVIQQANEYMEAKDKSLQCTDFPFMVEVAHSDGSRFMFHNARTERTTFNGFEMLLVWTEHCGYHAFFMDDLDFWRPYKIV